jgi:hypothetical protein
VLSAELGKVVDCPHCGGWVDVPELGRTPSTAEVEEAAALRKAREYERQLAEGSRQLAENARQIEQSQRALDHRDQQDDRFDQLLDRMEAVIGQWELLAAGVRRVVDRLDG